MTKKKVEEIPLNEVEKKLTELLKRQPYTVKELSRLLDKSSAGVVDVIDGLNKKGLRIFKGGDVIFLSEELVEFGPEVIKPIRENEVKIAIVADSLLGSKYQQLTAFYGAVKWAEVQNVDFMVHLGVSAGKPTKKNSDEFFKKTFSEQVNYIVNNYPKSERFKIRLVSGWHDMTWRSGNKNNILAEVCEKRGDLSYRGDYATDFPLRRGPKQGARWPIFQAAYHGGDTGPYAKSYGIQGYIENLVNSVRDLWKDDKPDIVAVAGQGIFCDIRGGPVPNIFSLPALRIPSPSLLRKKNRAVAPSIGMVILTVSFNEDGTFSVVPEVYEFGARKKDYLEKVSDGDYAKDLTAAERKIIDLLQGSRKSAGELGQALDKNDETVQKTIDSINVKLEKHGFSAVFHNDSKSYELIRPEKTEINLNPLDFDERSFRTIEEGTVSDTHIGAKTALPSILEEAYEIFAARGIRAVNHLGDWSNGPSKHNEWKKGEIVEDRATPLTENIVRTYPLHEDITTYGIGGDHDRWFMDGCGYNLIQTISWIRRDINYLGIQSGERDLSKRDKNRARVVIMYRHYNFGSGYAKSYKGQNVIEQDILKNIDKEKKRYRGKTICMLSGGGHVYCAMLYKGVIAILLPCLQAQTGFIQGLGKTPDIGFVIFSITTREDGTLVHFKVEYFDRTEKALELMREAKKLEERPLLTPKVHKRKKKTVKKEDVEEEKTEEKKQDKEDKKV